MSGFMLHGLGDCAPERHCGCLDIPAMTAPEPTAEHIDAVARVVHRFVESHDRDEMVMELLTSTDPAVHAALAASLPAEVMLAALVDRGTLTLRWRIRYGHGGGTSRAMRPGERAITVDGDVVERRYATGWEVAR